MRDRAASLACVAMADAVKFRFSSEQLLQRGDAAAAAAAASKEPEAESVATDGFMDSLFLVDRTKWTTEAGQNGGFHNWMLKYSVVNVFADTWACFCCTRCSRLGCTRPMTICGCTLYRMSWTRAQWIWLLNLLCLVVHSSFAYLSFNSCNTTRFGQRVNEDCTAAGMSIPIYRLAITWASTSAGGYEVSLVENNQPIRIDYLTGTFFLLSAVFHGLAVLVGPFELFAPYYWKQLDNALGWWCVRHPPPSSPLFLLVAHPFFSCSQAVGGILVLRIGHGARTLFNLRNSRAEFSVHGICSHVLHTDVRAVGRGRIAARQA